jgi:hypothetical protein
MDAAEIDVGSGIFECGQTYVALSRVKSMDGLYLTSFDANKIRINKKVKGFYESLTLYHESKEKTQEIYEPLILEMDIKPSQNIQSIHSSEPELSEETYKDTSNIKVITL